MSEPIALVVGLGNPGDKYDRTRHNVGFWFLDALSRKYDAPYRHQAKLNGDIASAQLGRNRFYLAKPTTFMNLSGNCVGACANYYRIEAPAILVVHDELDLPAGTLRLKKGGGHGGHNGLRDIINHVGKVIEKENPEIRSVLLEWMLTHKDQIPNCEVSSLPKPLVE
ncbi:MAG: aminoacyl-tRNA hydrolase [Pseudomonadota bacterium]